MSHALQTIIFQQKVSEDKRERKILFIFLLLLLISKLR